MWWLHLNPVEINENKKISLPFVFWQKIQSIWKNIQNSHLKFSQLHSAFDVVEDAWTLVLDPEHPMPIQPWSQSRSVAASTPRGQGGHKFLKHGFLVAKRETPEGPFQSSPTHQPRLGANSPLLDRKSCGAVLPSKRGLSLEPSNEAIVQGTAPR